MNAGLIIAECELGRGVFAGRAYEPGDVLLRFTGRLITHSEAFAKTGRSMDPLQIAPRLYLDLEAPGVFVNHSCDPNAAVRDDLFLVARRRIAEGEEIRFDYSTTMAEDLETMECRCGSALCRGVVRDFLHVPPCIRETYLAEGIVQGFIASTERSNQSGFALVAEV